MSGQFDEAFAVLGVPAGSDREAVSRAYRRRARATHPDVSVEPDAADRFAAVTAAYRKVLAAPDLGGRRQLTGDGRRPTSSFLAEPVRRSASSAAESVGEDWPAPPWSPSPSELARFCLRRWAPFTLVGTGPRPDIVVGPAMVQQHPTGASKEPVG